MGKFVIERIGVTGDYISSYLGELTTGSHECSTINDSILDLIRIFEKRFKYIRLHKGEENYDILNDSLKEITDLDLDNIKIDLIGIDFNKYNEISFNLKSKLKDFIEEVTEYEINNRL